MYLIVNTTRKLSYCKDDRAMIPVYECPVVHRPGNKKAQLTQREARDSLGI